MEKINLKRIAGEFSDEERTRLFFRDFHSKHWGNGESYLSDFEGDLLIMMTNKGVIAKYADLYRDFCELMRDIAQEYVAFQVAYYSVDKLRYRIILDGLIKTAFLSFSIVGLHSDKMGKRYLDNVTQFLSQVLIMEDNASDGTVIIKDEFSAWLKEGVKKMYSSACLVKTIQVIIDKIFSEMGITYSDDGNNKLPSPRRYLDSIETLINNHNNLILDSIRDVKREGEHFTRTSEMVTHRKNVKDFKDFIIQDLKVDDALYAEWERKLSKIGKNSC